MKTNHTKDEQITPDKRVEDWKEKVRDWWYSIQDLLAEKDICLHERKRVEIETIIKDTLTQYHQDLMSELVENEDMSNSILRIVHELSSIKEIKPAHIVELTDSIVEAIKFFAKIDGGRLHLIDLEKRVSEKEAQTIIKSK